VAIDLAVGLSVNTPWADWVDSTKGGALGIIYRIGLQYEMTQRLSIDLSASAMVFDGNKTSDLGEFWEQTHLVQMERANVGLSIHYHF
jgi:hypothetical protein